MASGARNVAVLTAAGALGDDVVAAALEALGHSAGEARRTAGTAVEVALGGAADVAALRDAVAGLALDLNVVSTQGREKRVLIADMDSTIIAVECIDELADFAGVKDEVARITEAAMRGELDFEEALRARVALLEGLGEDVLAECHAARVRLNPGAAVLARTMAARGAVTALVSGGFTYFAERVAAEAGFSRFQANVLLAERGRLTGKVADPILGREAKRAALDAVLAETGLSLGDVLAVGDGANDLAIVEAAGLGVAYHGKPALKAGARAHLDHSDLTALLALQGIAQEAWVQDSA